MKNLGFFKTIGDLWASVGREILSAGIEVNSGDEYYKEIKGITLELCYSSETDYILEEYGDKDEIAWMKRNFEEIGEIPELGFTNSYAERLYQYSGEKNQIDWVINKIKHKRSARSATITTFEPLSDISYVPCISLFDFDLTNDALDLYIYARSLDFGSKAYCNLLCIMDIMKNVASSININMGTVHLICKSAHIYDCDFDRMNRLVKSYTEE